MHTLPFYYVREVLGVKTALKPHALRTVYNLSRPLAQQTDFLFFCDTLKTPEAKSLVKNIVKALKAEEEQVAEILDLHSLHLTFLLTNLLTRFQPKGFVVFGKELAEKLIPPSCLRTDPAPITKQAWPVSHGQNLHQGGQNASLAVSDRGSLLQNKEGLPSERVLPVNKEKKGSGLKVPYSAYVSLPVNQHEEILVSGCVIHSIRQLTSPDPAQTQKAKQEAWRLLHKIFLQKTV